MEQSKTTLTDVKRKAGTDLSSGRKMADTAGLWESESDDEDWKPTAEAEAEAEVETGFDLEDTRGTGDVDDDDDGGDKKEKVVAVGTKRRGGGGSGSGKKERRLRKGGIALEGEDNGGEDVGLSAKEVEMQKESYGLYEEAKSDRMEKDLEEGKSKEKVGEGDGSEAAGKDGGGDEIMPNPKKVGDHTAEITPVKEKSGTEQNVLENKGVGKANGENDAQINRDLTEEAALVENVHKVNEDDSSKKIPVDDKQLLADLNKPVSRKPRKTIAGIATGKSTNGLGSLSSLLGSDSSPGFNKDVASKEKPKTFALLDDAELESGNGPGKDKVAEKDDATHPRVGLDAVVKDLKKSADKAPGVLDKSREAWKDFKEGSQELKVELDSHRKDKNRYTDKVGFLNRVEAREWEKEQAQKRTGRSKR